MTKIHIDLNVGVLEVEGEEEFVKLIYDDFKERLAEKNKPQLTQEVISNSSIKDTVAFAKKTKRSSKSPSSTERYTLIKDLDFTKGEGGITLKNFYAQKSPTSFAEKNALFVYFLKNKLKTASVTLNHIYTCYEEVGSRKPDAFRQSVADTSSKKGWLDTSSFENITISIRGQNYIEHDLPIRIVEKK